MSRQQSLNFSTRQNKSIERSLVFESLRALQANNLFKPIKYVGFGSVWFVDFQMAHRVLNPVHLLSIEKDPNIASRAKFNRPFRNIDVEQGEADKVLPVLMDQDDKDDFSWVVWLDYDGPLESVELESILETAGDLPRSSVLLTTFNVRRRSYWIKDRKDTVHLRLERLFGSDVAGSIDPTEVETGEQFTRTMSNLVHEAISDRLRTYGGSKFAPIVSVPYSDTSADMLTVGGYIGSTDDVDRAKKIADHEEWPGIATQPINYDPLTLKEVLELRSLLPTEKQLTATTVKTELGIELSERDVIGFQNHYKRFPVYSDIASNL